MNCVPERLATARLNLSVPQVILCRPRFCPCRRLPRSDNFSSPLFVLFLIRLRNSIPDGERFFQETRVKVAHRGGQVREVGGQNLLTRGRHLPFGGTRSLQKGLAPFLV